ncbi:MAG TPA: uracil-DNA glycosylase family protein [Arachidicoccus sp.]|nr:uracil-DNA glycosylase family protein [Arachidicoccus sp.]
MEQEIHPHGPFIPDNLRCLILGSFPGRPATINTDPDNQWFYSAKRNQFWKIMEGVFRKPLQTRSEKEKLMALNGIGLTDIFSAIRRKNDSNLDQDLEIITFNDTAIRTILVQYPNVKVCFTSRFVEKHFRKLFPDFRSTVLLPSPSPRYARMSLLEKTQRYTEILCP